MALQEPQFDEKPVCDCGYRCQGETADARILDAQRHAREAHGIDVTADQIRGQRSSPA